MTSKVKVITWNILASEWIMKKDYPDIKKFELFNSKKRIKIILDKLKTTVSVERIRDEVFKMMKHDTIASIKLLTEVDTNLIPGFFELVFSKGLWLKPTFEL